MILRLYSSRTGITGDEFNLKMERHRVTGPKNKISVLAALNSKRLAAASWKRHL